MKLGCGTVVGAHGAVLVVQALSIGVVAVAVDEQHGPVAIRTPRPAGLGDTGQGSAGNSQSHQDLGVSGEFPIPSRSVDPFRNSQFHGGFQPLGYLVQQRPAHGPTAVDVSIQGHLCGTGIRWGKREIWEWRFRNGGSGMEFRNGGSGMGVQAGPPYPRR